MKEADAAHFLSRRSRRGAKSQDEINGEFTLGLFEAVCTEVCSAKLVFVCGICWHLFQNHSYAKLCSSLMAQSKVSKWLIINQLSNFMLLLIISLSYITFFLDPPRFDI